MSPTREKLVTGSLLLSESAWLVALFGLLSFPFGATSSPLSWIAILAVMGISLIWARTLGMVIMPSIVAYGLQMLAGVIVVYLMVATQVSPDGDALNLGWIGTLTAGESSERFALRAVYGSLGGAALWWRGGHIGAADLPVDSLSASFKVGILIMAAAAVLDIAQSADLNVFPMMFIFFASGVAGLSVAHMASITQQQSAARAWTRIIGVIVGALVVLGLLFSLLQESVLSAIAAPFGWALGLIGKAVFYLIIFPLAYVVDFITRMIFALLLMLGGEPQQDRAPATLEGVANFEAFSRGGEAEPIAVILLTILQWSIVAAIVIGALLLMALAFKRRSRLRSEVVDGERESLVDGADVTYDFANLLFNMLPSRFRRRTDERFLRVPADDPNIVDVFRIYFGLLSLGEKRGYPRQTSETPHEYQRTLEGLFPSRLVRAATEAFTRACYGHHPASRDEINEMRTELERVAASKD